MLENSYNHTGPHFGFLFSINTSIMEKRILGVVLSLLGAVGLVYAGIQFVNGAHGNRSIKAIIFAAVVGVIFFFAGVGLVRSTRDRPT